MANQTQEEAETVELGEENRFLVDQLAAADRELAHWKAQREEAAEKILKLLQGKRTGTIGGAMAVRATYVQPTMILDQAKVKDRYPSVYIACQKLKRGYVKLQTQFSEQRR